MSNNFAFCENCGEPLVLGNNTECGKKITHEQKQESSWEPTNKFTQEPRKSFGQNAETHRKKPGTAMTIAAMCLAAILLVTVGFVTASLLRRSSEPKPASTEAPAENPAVDTYTDNGDPAVVPIDPTPATSSQPERTGPAAAPVWINPTEQTEPPIVPSTTAGATWSQTAPFYGIWCYGSTDSAVAEKNRLRLAESGFDARVFVTTDWSNLNSQKYYVVTAGIYSSYSEAEAMLPTVKTVVKDAYIKYSGDWKGATNPNVPFGASAFTGWLGSYSQRSFAGAYASSEFVEGNIRFIASYAINDGINRPWVEGVSGSGIGETLTLYFQSDTTVSVIDLTLGYARDSKRYYGNNRPSLLRFSFSDGSSFDCAFQDVMADQAILLSRPVSTTYIEITILDVYYGTDNDTCIYLVKAYG